MKAGELCQSIKTLAQIIKAAGPSEVVVHLEVLAGALTGSEKATVSAFVKNAGSVAMDASREGVRLRVVLPVLGKFLELIALTSSKATASDLKTFIDFITTHQDATIQAFVTACRTPAKTPAKPKVSAKAKAESSPEALQIYVDRLQQSYKQPTEFYAVFTEVKGLLAAEQVVIAKELLGGKKSASGKAALERIEGFHKKYMEQEREDRASEGRSAA
jgi:hypothetical protein